MTALTNQIELSNQKQIKNYYDCVDKHTIKKFTDLAYEMYNSKITLPSFIGKLFSLEAKKIVEVSQCASNISGISQANGTILTKLGMTLLYSSNCSKDVGPALIILDGVLVSLKNIKTQWKDAITNSIVFGYH